MLFVAAIYGRNVTKQIMWFLKLSLNVVSALPNYILFDLYGCWYDCFISLLLAFENLLLSGHLALSLQLRL